MKTPIEVPAGCFRSIAVFGFSLALAFLSGCSPNDALGDKALFQIPWPTASGDYRLQNVEISSYTHPTELRGSLARVIVEPYLEGGRLAGKPVGRFTPVARGVFVPSDYLTLQATAIYAHLERLHDLDQGVGAAKYLNWPLTVALQTNVIDENGAVVNNALFDSRLDALLIVPYTETQLPIALNGGIHAHEHFHKIFQSLVMKKVRAKRKAVPGKDSSLAGLAVSCSWGLQGELSIDSEIESSGDSPPKRRPIRPRELAARFKPGPTEATSEHMVTDVSPEIFNEFMLRALNEGLADFWGWVYTGDSAYIGRSLNELQLKARRLDQSAGQLPGREFWRLDLLEIALQEKADSKRVRLAYEMGTYYARFLRELALLGAGGTDGDLRSRQVVARAVIDALVGLGDEFAALAARDELISPNSIVQALYAKLPKVGADECRLYDEFAAPAHDEKKPAACEEFNEKSTTKDKPDEPSSSPQPGRPVS